MPNMSNEELTELVNAKLDNVYMSTKGEYVEYFRDRYGQNWTPYAAAFFAGTGDKKSLAYKSSIRQFQGGRADRPATTSDVKARFAQLGKQLPPVGKRPPAKIKITASGRLKVSEGRRKGQKGDRNRPMRGDGWSRFSTSQVLTGSDAIAPTFDAFFTDYFTNFDENPVTDFEITGLDIEISYDEEEDFEESEYEEE